MNHAPKRKLRSGFTTGAAAAAAAKGAVRLLLENAAPRQVRIRFLTGDWTTIAVHHCRREGADRAVCTVIKDAGDDPDITHKAEIGAEVMLTPAQNAQIVEITGGKGVGTVTLPGLEVPPGAPAINPGPLCMIRESVTQVLTRTGYTDAVKVTVFVLQGERLAKKTLNPRLGILGGLSILGTTGIERPMSHEAYVATIRSALSVARAVGCPTVVMSTGRRSERFARRRWPDLPEAAFVQIGDFFRRSLEMAVEFKLPAVILAVFFGKAVKMAQGVPHTHAAKSAMSMAALARWTLEVTDDPAFADRIKAANTARHAFGMFMDRHTRVIDHVGEKMVASARKFAGSPMDIQGVVFDYDGNAVFDSAKTKTG